MKISCRFKSLSTIIMILKSIIFLAEYDFEVYLIKTFEAFLDPEKKYLKMSNVR